jgi:hypothetical protein
MKKNSNKIKNKKIKNKLKKNNTSYFWFFMKR